MGEVSFFYSGGTVGVLSTHRAMGGLRFARLEDVGARGWRRWLAQDLIDRDSDASEKDDTEE